MFENDDFDLNPERERRRQRFDRDKKRRQEKERKKTWSFDIVVSTFGIHQKTVLVRVSEEHEVQWIE